MEITVTVNGTDHSSDVEPRMLLADLPAPRVGPHRHAHRLRHHQLRRVHRAARRHADEVVHDVRGPGRRPQLTTVEGLSRRRRAPRCRRRSRRSTACSAGSARPGMMLVGAALLEQNPDPTEDDVRWAISGNLCRCTGYMNIVKAISAAAAEGKAVQALPEQRTVDHPGATGSDDVTTTARTQRRPPRGSAASATRVTRVEDDRFVAGPGQLPRRHHAARHAAHGDPAFAGRPRATGHQSTPSAAAALPGVVAVVTGELLAAAQARLDADAVGRHQAVLATDKVRFQGQEVAAVVADRPLHRVRTRSSSSTSTTRSSRRSRRRSRRSPTARR